MSELDFITDMVEEKLVKGNLRWLANFKEIHRDYTIGETVFPIYASGGLEERGFFSLSLARIYSAMVTPKYKVQFLLYTADETDGRELRKLILTCKNKFGPEDWIFLEIAQNKPIDKSLKEAVKNLADTRVGLVVTSLASGEEIVSGNVLGRNLSKQLRLAEAKFESFDPIDYSKGFAIVFVFGTLTLIFLQAFFLVQAVNIVSLLLVALFSTILGYRIYRTRYHIAVKLDSKGFEVWKGRKSSSGKWTDFSDASIYVAPNRDVLLRLTSRKNTMDLPISRVGVARKDIYMSVKRLLKKSSS